MSEYKRYESVGVHTIEGNVAGRRAAELDKQREKQKQEFDAKREEIQRQNQRGALLDKNFESSRDDADAEFKRQTVGLVSAAEFRKRREDIENRKDTRIEATEKQDTKVTKKPKKKRKAKTIGALSFSLDDEEEVDASKPSPIAQKKKKITKDPDVDTDFLPDKDREEEEAKERQRLQVEWEQEQERIRNEQVAVTYSYWDGSGHRREITVAKKTTIGKYLELVRQQLSSEFSELRGISAENLMYIKEDLIIPHHYSFYDLIVTKARGKSGPLFHFDVHDDVRLINDVRVEKDESHPGKVVERHWYEKNKHIFPASRWEVYDPNVQRDRYTIHGDEVHKKK